MATIHTHPHHASRTPRDPQASQNVESRTAEPLAVDAVRSRARQLQAQAIRDMIRAIGRGIARGGRWLLTATVAWIDAVGDAAAARRTFEELSRLSDLELADIGLTREDIAAAAWYGTRRGRAALQADDAAEATAEPEHRKAA